MTRLRRTLARRLRALAYRLDPVRQWSPRTLDSPFARHAVATSQQGDLDAWLHNHVTMPAEWMTRVTNRTGKWEPVGNGRCPLGHGGRGE